MTLYLRGKTWWYDFWFDGVRYNASTKLKDREAAATLQTELQQQLAFQRAGLEPPASRVTPRFQEWAEVYYVHRARKVQHPERIEEILRVILRFFGARPATGAIEGEPYHDLRLGDVVNDPYWIERFEQWMDTRRFGREGHLRPISNQTKKHYLSQASMMFRVASSPRFRKRTNVFTNPFAGVERPPTQSRTVTLSVDELRRLLTHASYHVRLAVSIAALAPKLRLSNILRLRWNDNLDPLWKQIMVGKHKTDKWTGAPLVVPVVPQLRLILEDALRRARGSEWVVTYRSRPVEQIRGGLRNAAVAAGLTYGQRAGGLTFHTIRHSMATLLAELGEPERIRMEVLGHTRHSTSQRYTHLRPVHQIPTLTRLSSAVPIEDLVRNSNTRATRRTVGTSVTVTPAKAEKP